MRVEFWLFKSMDQVFDFHRPFKSGEQIPLFVIHSQVRHKMHLIEGGESILNIFAHGYILEPLQVIFFIERFHQIEWHNRGHDNLNIF